VLLSITEFIGHFHPVVVHLPVGILLVALLLQWLSRREKYKSFRGAVPFLFLSGTIAAFVSCISGYFLSISDDYDESLVNWHMWLAITLTFVSFVLYAKERNPLFAVNKNLLSLAVLILVFVTGHLGGSLTHGSDYFSKPLKDIFNNDNTATTTIKPIANVQEAAVYHDVIKPILETKCYSCHNANKQKGGLRMDDSLLLMKGGKDGKVIAPGNASASEMIKRLLLPVDNDDHMPPKEKPQLSEQQIALLHWWIENNSDFIKKVKELSQTERIKPMLLALQKVEVIKKPSFDIPATPVEKADDKLVAQLKQKGVIVLPVAQNSNYLLLNFVTHPVIDKGDLELMQQIKKQVIWLKLDNTDINDDGLAAVTQLTNLTKLYLSHTSISDKGVSRLQALSNLVYLNLVATNITAQGLMPLQNLTKLQSLYLYKTNISKNDWSTLKTIFPKTLIDSGGYRVPLFSTDTTLVKSNVKY
jgi:uncharacterized membrane protein/mono/diheme cytochrome c family protein